MLINLELGKSNFQIIKFNQYDKNYNFQIKLNNYEFKANDLVKIEWVINNNVAVIQSDYITREGNLLNVKLLREVTLNAGKGYFNVVVDNTKDNSRQATFKNPLEIISNSIDEDTVSSVLLETTIEALRKNEASAREVLADLLSAISTGKLSNYLPIKGGNLTGNIVFENAEGVRGTNNDGTLATLLYVSSANKNTFGNQINPTVISSKGNPQAYVDGKTYNLYHKGNILDLFPIGVGVIPTANNTNPSTYIGGKWELIGQGMNIAGVGTGTDKNGVTKKIVVGENEGEYEHTITMNEIPVHTTKQDGSDDFGLGLSGSFANRVIVNKDSSQQTSIDLTSPSYGLYWWKRIG